MSTTTKPVDGLNTRTLSDVDPEAKRAELQRLIDAEEKSWGRWKYDASNPPSLDLHGPYVYCITLDRLESLWALGDWQIHLGQKRWITAADLGHLTLAILDLNRVGYLSIGRGSDNLPTRLTN